MRAEPHRPRVPASTINPDAGDYRITADAAEQAAAAAAAEASWRAFPYYAHRYGERGWRFSLSDSAWLPTLCGRPEPHALGKLRWLQGLLVSRGMPSYLLERHLDFLGAELARLCGDRLAQYEILTRGVAILRAERTRVVDHAEFMRLATEFDDSVAGIEDRVPSMGVVLAAGAIDEAGGHARGLASVEEWACDRTRFSAAWVTAATAAIERMRQAACSTPTCP
jgi:hypothetical protein